METRGRKSKASLAVVDANVIDVVQRPDAPSDLTDEQATEWMAVVEAMPADWFPREVHSLLGQYCRHVVNARRMSQIIEAMASVDPLDLDEYDKALKMQEREGRAMSSLATRLRITTQATVRAESAKKKTAVKKPWS